MDYKGSGVRLQSGELKELCESFGLTEAHGKTVIQVETSGKGFNNVGWPEFLFEPHRFYAELKTQPNKLREAIASGLAYPAWKGPGSYPKTPQLRVQQFLKAAELDETAAIKSASWGLGQIMGSECIEAGYSSPQEMLKAFADSEHEQVKGMLNLIKHRGLDRDLLNFPDMAACRHFALRYNGKAYEKNKYHIKLHDAYVRNSRASHVRENLDPMADGSLTFGEKDSNLNGPIRQMQQKLRNLGYSLKVDGDFGSGTRATILAWKANEGMDTSSPNMSLADLEMLNHSAPMPIPQERASATVDELKPQAPIIQKTSLGQKVLAWFGLGTGSIGVAGSSGFLDQAQDMANKADQAKGLLGQVKYFLGETGIATLLQFIYEWRFPLLLVGVVVGFYIYRQIREMRVNMHRNAEIA